MKNNRRNFLKIAGMAGIGMASAGMASCSQKKDSAQTQRSTAHEKFNMHGFAAPAIDIVRIGIIGIGGRGTAAVRRLTRIDGLEIKAQQQRLPLGERYFSLDSFRRPRPHIGSV